jgi:hypothetical protein
MQGVCPAECRIMLDAIGMVYGCEEQTLGMSPEQRLRHHQENSGPVMAGLKAWIEKQFAERLVEPNSSLGKALQYWRNPWEKMTVWLGEPGAPLDNNEAERSLKQFILMRKNSLFFKTEHGAAIGDILASLIQSCRFNGVNALDYLATIIGNRADARRNPHRYQPWNYKSNHREGDEAEALVGLKIGRGKLSPGRSELRLLRQAVVKHNGKLLRRERMRGCVLSVGPPASSALGKPAGDEPEAMPVITKEFERGSPPVAQDEESFGERVFLQRPLAQRGQAIDSIAKINRLTSEPDSELWDELNHRVPARRKSSQNCLVKWRSRAGCVIVRREPSGRSS